jgi:hypothetical protein
MSLRSVLTSAFESFARYGISTPFMSAATISARPEAAKNVPASLISSAAEGAFPLPKKVMVQEDEFGGLYGDLSFLGRELPREQAPVKTYAVPSINDIRKAGL